MTKLEIILALLASLLAGGLTIAVCSLIRIRKSLAAEKGRLHIAEGRIESYRDNIKYYCTLVESLKGDSVILQKEVDARGRRYEKAKRLLSKILRQKTTYSRSMTWLETPDQDIRVLESQVREQLSIDLQTAGDIKFKTNKVYVDRYMANEVTVTGTINIINRNL